MTQTPEKAESRWAELSDEVLESVEASRKQAIESVRKFVDQVTGDIPDEAKRKNVIDAALDLTEELVTGRIEFFRSVVRSAGQVVTHRQLLADVWGAEYVEHTHYLRLYMGQLRAKLEAEPANPQLLLTEPGVGYRLKVHSTG